MADLNRDTVDLAISILSSIRDSRTTVMVYPSIKSLKYGLKVLDSKIASSCLPFHSLRGGVNESLSFTMIGISAILVMQSQIKSFPDCCLSVGKIKKMRGRYSITYSFNQRIVLANDGCTHGY